MASFLAHVFCCYLIVFPDDDGRAQHVAVLKGASRGCSSSLIAQGVVRNMRAHFSFVPFVDVLARSSSLRVLFFLFVHVCVRFVINAAAASLIRFPDGSDSLPTSPLLFPLN